jgi:hypothetical protein
LSSEDFVRGWHALLWLFPDLHPENALEHGDDEHDAPAPAPNLERRYTRSGWPVALALIGEDAWRRFKAEEISDEAFYCVEAQRAGMTKLSSLSNRAQESKLCEA